MQRGQGVWYAVLVEVVARGHFAAETVAAIPDRHPVLSVGSGLYQHRHVQPRQAKRVRYRAFVSEIGKRDDDALD